MAAGAPIDMTIRKVSVAARRRLKMITASEDVKMAGALDLVTRLHEVMAHEIRVNGSDAAGARRWLEAAGFTLAGDSPSPPTGRSA